MVPRNLLKKNKTIGDWVEIIEQKFDNKPFTEQLEHISNYLNIVSDKELSILKEAIIEREGKRLGVTSFDDACNKLGISTDLSHFSKINDEFKEQQIAFYKLSIIIRVLNNGWIPNWKDSNEKKWFNYWNLGFSDYRTSYYSTSTSVPSALYLKNKELCEYVKVRFESLYNNLHK